MMANRQLELLAISRLPTMRESFLRFAIASPYGSAKATSESLKASSVILG